MKKTLLYSTVAGLALLASACGTNTANNDNGTAGTNAYGGGMFTRTNNGTYVQDYNMAPNGRYGVNDANGANGMVNMRGRNTTFGTDNNNNNVVPNYYNGYNTNAFTGNGYGNNVRATDQANYRMNAPIYRKYANDRTAGAQGNGMTQMGYVKMDRNQMRTNSDTRNTVYVDRDALAQCVGNVTASVPGVNTSTVLVSDEEVFVGVTCQAKDKRSIINRARMNAMSISPRYFKVYVTDNQSMINELSRVASRGNNVNVQNPHNDQAVENLVKRFGGTPDGQEMNMNRTTGKGHMSR